MPIIVRCSNCNKKLHVPSKLAGQTTDCPACKQPISVPASATQNAAEAVPAADKSTVQSDIEAMPGFSPAAKPVFAHEREEAEKNKKRQIQVPDDLGRIVFSFDKVSVGTAFKDSIGGPVMIALSLIAIPILSLMVGGMIVSLTRLVFDGIRGIPYMFVGFPFVICFVALWYFAVYRGIERSFFNIREQGIEFVSGAPWNLFGPVQLVHFSNIKALVSGDTTGFVGFWLSTIGRFSLHRGAVGTGAAQTMVVERRRGSNLPVHNAALIYSYDSRIRFNQLLRKNYPGVRLEF